MDVGTWRANDEKVEGRMKEDREESGCGEDSGFISEIDQMNGEANSLSALQLNAISGPISASSNNNT